MNTMNQFIVTIKINGITDKQRKQISRLCEEWLEEGCDFSYEDNEGNIYE